MTEKRKSSQAKEPTPEARRALEEAAERRKEPSRVRPDEFGGRKGSDPTRFGDWEKDGIVSDF